MGENKTELLDAILRALSVCDLDRLNVFYSFLLQLTRGLN